MFADARRKKRRSDALIRNPTKKDEDMVYPVETRRSQRGHDVSQSRLSCVLTRGGGGTRKYPRIRRGRQSLLFMSRRLSFVLRNKQAHGETRRNDAVTNRNHSNLFVRPRVISFVLVFFPLFFFVFFVVFIITVTSGRRTTNHEIIIVGMAITSGGA